MKNSAKSPTSDNLAMKLTMPPLLWAASIDGKKKKDSPFEQSISKIVSECFKILKVKGDDYTDNKDRLSNFKGFPGVDPKVVLSIYMHKHYIAVQNYCLRGKLESEPIRGRICDMINYLLLLNFMVETQDDRI